MKISPRRALVRGFAILSVLLGVVSLPSPAMAQGDLLVAPTRVILDGRRGTEIILSNIGSEEATYRIGLELRRMTENGDLVEVDPANATDKERAALEMIRYAPRRITLPPGQPQSVRLGARPGAELPDGEYRVHMSFKAIPTPTVASAEELQPDGIAIKLVPIYGVTIPVMVRHGRLEAQVALADPAIVQGPDNAEFQVVLSRSGGSSTYGEIRVVPQGASEPAMIARGVAVYAEMDQRRLVMALTPEQVAAMRGPVTIEYREMPEAGGRVLASIETIIG